jgi:SAM-dependent methyltransferase
MRLPWRRRPEPPSPLRVAFDEGYAAWAATYPPVPHNPLMEVEHQAVASRLSRVKATHALDVGSGTGRLLPLLERTGATTIVAADLSLPMLQRGRRARVCADACRLPFPDAAFDVVSASLMVGDLPDLRAWTTEMSRLLRAAGHLIYSDFHPSWITHGWRRTFRAEDGRELELPYFPHTIEDHLSALADAKLDVRAIREPRVENRRDPIVVIFDVVRRAAC